MKIECANPVMLARIRSTHLLTFHHPDNKRERRVVMSVLKVIQKIHEIYPEASVENIVDRAEKRGRARWENLRLPRFKRSGTFGASRKRQRCCFKQKRHNFKGSGNSNTIFA